MSKKHYFILATQVLYLRDSIERSRNFNVLLTNDNPFVNRRHLGLAQQQAQIRFRNEFDPKGTAEIKDVFIMAVSNLGEMTAEEFHEGFEVPPDEVEQPDQAPEITETETVTETPVDDVTAPEAIPQPELEPAPPATPAVPDTTDRTPVPTPDEPDVQPSASLAAEAATEVKS